MNKIILFLFPFMVIMQASNIKNEKSKMIDLNAVKVKYINFTPKKIDEDCLVKKIDKLFKIIEISRRKSPHQLAQEGKFYPEKTIKITRQEVEKLSGQLLSQKHISTKGNHEWRELVSHEHIVIEDKKRRIYILYPLEPMMFIMSGISFKKINEGESILVRGLKDWIDMKECMQF